MWSNLVRFDHQRARAEADVEATFTILLRKEIEILRPDVVLFLTGPEYDSSISKAFTGVIILTLSPRFELRQLAWLKHQELPETTFRTYHPGFLNRKPWRDAVKAEIVRAANIDQKFRQ
jgi:uracil-DNA glycosylase